VPAPGSPQATDYLNLMKPATPNVLLTFTLPVTVRLRGGLQRSARRLGLCLDEPDAFIRAVADSSAT